MAQAKSVAKKPAQAATKAASSGVKLVDLTPDEFKRLARPREDFEAHVAPLLALYAEESAELAIKSLDVRAMKESFESYQALAAEEATAKKHLEMVQETRALHASKVWGGMLEIYAKAQAAARTNKDIARGTADFASFMSTGPRKKKTGTGREGGAVRAGAKPPAV